MQAGADASNQCFTQLSIAEQDAIDNGTPLTTASIDAAAAQCQSLKLILDGIAQRMAQSWAIDDLGWPAFVAAVIPGADYKFLWFNIDGVIETALEPVPEPASMALFAAGLLGIATLRRRARS